MELLDNYIKDKPKLEECRDDIIKAYDILIHCFQAGGKLLVCGNGGSAADANHIVGELMKGFLKKRSIPDELRRRLTAAEDEFGTVLADHLQQALPAIALTVHDSLITAYSNDARPDLVFAQQVYGYGTDKDVLLGISTSGNSENVLYAAHLAAALGLKTIGLTGRNGGKLKGICNVAICVPEEETYKIQELHLPVYHLLCLMVEDHFFKS